MLCHRVGFNVGQPDTRQFWKRELSTLAQYLVVTLAAGLITFLWATASYVTASEYAWSRYSVMLYVWLGTFGLLAVIRLLGVFLLRLIVLRRHARFK